MCPTSHGEPAPVITEEASPEYRSAFELHPHIFGRIGNREVIDTHAEKFSDVVQRHVESVVAFEFVAAAADFEHGIPIDILCHDGAAPLAFKGEQAFASFFRIAGCYVALGSFGCLACGVIGHGAGFVGPGVSPIGVGQVRCRLIPIGAQYRGMTDRRDTGDELATVLTELETTLTQLRGALDEEAPVGQTGRERRRESVRREGQRFPRPPGFREVMRFTEQQTIPTLIAILEANIRLLQLAGAALRAVDPERSAVETGERTAVSSALDTGGRLSADRLSSGLDELQRALSGTDAPNPEAKELLEDAERLSAEVRQRIREREGGRFSGRKSSSDMSDGMATGGAEPVQIEVEDATEATDEEEAENDDDSDSDVDVDAELNSIRDEVRGGPTDGESPEAQGEAENSTSDDDGETGDDSGTNTE